MCRAITFWLCPRPHPLVLRLCQACYSAKITAISLCTDTHLPVITTREFNIIQCMAMTISPCLQCQTCDSKQTQYEPVHNKIMCAQWTHGSAWASVWFDLSLRCAHRCFCWLCHAMAVNKSPSVRFLAEQVSLLFPVRDVVAMNDWCLKYV